MFKERCLFKQLYCVIKELDKNKKNQVLRGALGAVILDGQTESLTYIKHRDRQNNISKSLLLACNTFSINKFAKKKLLDSSRISF